MKIRQGFVSNSSSSSFVCDITGYSEVAYDGIAEIGMCECENGHTFLYEGYSAVEEYVSENEYYDIPEAICPICNGEAKAKIVDRLKKELVYLKLTPEDLL